MATGASNLSGERISFFERAFVPKSSNVFEGAVVVSTSDSGDNLIVDLPTAATALNNGRAFVGISCGQGTTVAYTSTSPPGDQQVTIQMAGVAKCALKANTACVRYGEAAFDPTDGGYIVPYTSKKQIKIGKFTQTKSSSSSAQFVGVWLDQGSDLPDVLVGAITTTSSAVTNTASETAFDQSVTIPANMLTVGSVLRVKAKVAATATNGTDTLQILSHLNTTGGVTLATSSAVDVADNDLATFDFEITVRTIGAGGTIEVGGDSIVKTTAKAVGTVGTVAIDTTAANAIIISALWSNANAGNSCRLEHLSVSLMRVSN